MFIRPVHGVVRPARRRAGVPLLRGALARGAYVWKAPEPAAADASPPPGLGPGPGSDRAPSPAAAAGSAPSAGAGLSGELAALAALARDGVLTPEEFTAAKARLLGGA